MAVKECLIKAIGGRPYPFSWHEFEIDTAGVRDMARGEELTVDDLGPLSALPFLALLAGGPVFTASCTVRGAARRDALIRLGCEQGRGEPTGVSMWGRVGSALLATAVLAVRSLDDKSISP